MWKEVNLLSRISAQNIRQVRLYINLYIKLYLCICVFVRILLTMGYTKVNSHAYWVKILIFEKSYLARYFRKLFAWGFYSPKSRVVTHIETLGWSVLVPYDTNNTKNSCILWNHFYSLGPMFGLWIIKISLFVGT